MLKNAAAAVMTTKAPTIFSALLFIFLLAMGLRLYELDTTSLCADELFTAMRIQRDLSSTIETVASRGDNPPLSIVIVGSLVTLFGDSDFVFRLASAVLGSLSVLLTYKVGEMLWTRKVGLVGSFLLAVNPFHIEYSQWARHYAITMFLVLVMLVLFLEALRTGRRGLWLGFAVAAALSLYNQYFAFLALGVLAIHGFCTIASSALARARSYDAASTGHSLGLIPDPRLQAMRLACSLGLAMLLFTPWLPSMVGHVYGPINWQGFGGAGALSPDELSGYLRRWLTEYAGTDGPLALGFLALSVLGLARSKREHAFFVVVWVVVPLLFSLTVASSKFAAPRYSIFILPIYLLVVARGGFSVASAFRRTLKRFAQEREERRLIATPLVALTFAVLCVAPLRGYYSSKPREDWHAVSQYLVDNMLPGDIILADGVGYGGIKDSPRAVMALRHYLPIHGTRDTPVLEVRRGLYGGITSAALPDARVWAVVWIPRAHSALTAEQRDSIVVFPGVLLIRPAEPSGDVVEDAASTLDVLLHLMPSETGRFDIHLALAGIRLGTGRLEDVQAELQRARAVLPSRPRASNDLAAFDRSALARKDIANATWCDFGGVVALVGYEVGAPSPESGHWLDLTLWWQALADMDRDYTAFVHLVGEDGRILAQEDRLLQRDDLPSSGWRLGSVATEEYHVQLGPDTASGDCLIKVGIYYWETAERLPVRDQQGRRLPDDAVLVSTVP